MNHILVSVFPDQTSADQGLDALRDLDREGAITLHESAVLAKDANANISVREASEVGPVGAAFGLTGGAFVGALGGPVGFAVGASVGGVVGALYDRFHAKMSAELIEDVGRTLRPGTVALVLDADEISGRQVDRQLEPLGAVTVRGSHREVMDEQLHRRVDAATAELDQLASELRDSDASLGASTRQKIEARINDIRALDERLQVEMDRQTAENARLLAGLRAQRELADAHRQAQIDARMAAVNADHADRLAKLRRSRELSKRAAELAAEALAPESLVHG